MISMNEYLTRSNSPYEEDRFQRQKMGCETLTGVGNLLRFSLLTFRQNHHPISEGHVRKKDVEKFISRLVH